MRTPRAILACVLLAISCVAQEDPSADLQHRADQASGVECARLSMQAARRSLEEANLMFEAANVKAAHNAIDRSLHYARRSVDCTLQSRKGEKSTEIDMRKLIRRMNDVFRTLDSEDRPHLTRTMVELEVQRDRLLRAMFGAAYGRGTAEKKP